MAWYKGLEQKETYSSLSDFPKGTWGFVYVIINHTKDLMYIGKKQLVSERYKTIAKSTYDRLRKTGAKDIKKTKSKSKSKRGKGGTVWNYKQFAPVETDWLTYTGSSKPLNEDISKGDKITKHIIMLAKSKRELTYLETRQLFDSRVLEQEGFYNDNILGAFFKNNLV